jgi:hypothetical protein
MMVRIEDGEGVLALDGHGDRQLRRFDADVNFILTPTSVSDSVRPSHRGNVRFAPPGHRGTPHV